jgi:PTH1 family peptidyl-tRNA hydrolase
MNNRSNSEDNSKYLIVGLGNPGKQYQNTRHNFGFMVLDELARTLKIEFRRMQHQAMVTKTHYHDRLLILAKPRTFMNNSGRSVRSLANFYKIPTENIFVIFDDADLDFETIRLRRDGGSSGQKGMASIIQSLGTEEFPRMRLGLGRPPGRMETADFVLLPFSKQEQEVLPFLLKKAGEAVLTFVDDGIDTAMNQFNTRTT